MNQQLQTNKAFTILQLTDIHLGPHPFHEKDERTFLTITSVINQTQPDMIVLTGDMIWTDGVSNPLESYTKLMEYLNQFPVSVAITYGNHDSEDKTKRELLHDIEKKHLKNAVKKSNLSMVKDRLSYTVQLPNSSEESQSSMLFMIDSGDYDEAGYGTYAYLLPEQIEWFDRICQNERKEIKRRDLVFQHIPVPEYHQLTSDFTGNRLEEVESPIINTGFASRMLLNKNIYGMFCGHDHDNDYQGKFHDIALHFGRVTGYHCYGQLPRGGRCIQLFPDHIETFLVDGEID